MIRKFVLIEFHVNSLLVKPQNDLVHAILVLKWRIISGHAIPRRHLAVVPQCAAAVSLSRPEALLQGGDLGGDVGVVHEAAEPPDGGIAMTARQLHGRTRSERGGSGWYFLGT